MPFKLFLSPSVWKLPGGIDIDHWFPPKPFHIFPLHSGLLRLPHVCWSTSSFEHFGLCTLDRKTKCALWYIILFGSWILHFSHKFRSCKSYLRNLAHKKNFQVDSGSSLVDDGILWLLNTSSSISKSACFMSWCEARLAKAFRKPVQTPRRASPIYPTKIPNIHKLPHSCVMSLGSVAVASRSLSPLWKVVSLGSRKTCSQNVAVSRKG